MPGSVPRPSATPSSPARWCADMTLDPVTISVNSGASIAIDIAPPLSVLATPFPSVPDDPPNDYIAIIAAAYALLETS